MDLLAVVFGVLMLAGWMVFSLFGERGRTASCKRNLKFLSQLMQEFANDHGGSIPPASIQKPLLGWDAQVAGYLLRVMQMNSGEVLFEQGFCKR